jgi:5-methylcytosine-specific restriction endonuclease McrA
MSRKKKNKLVGVVVPREKPCAKLVYLFSRDQGKCFWCNHPLKLGDYNKSSGKLRPTKDHLLPRSKGGKNHISNLVLSCSGCNNNKSDRLVNPKTGWAINTRVLSVLLKE